MNQMPCGNTQAEIDNDTDTEHAERTRYENLEAQYVYVLNRLLSGKNVYTFSASFSLAERMADKYQQFADFVDLDYDFMRAFKYGELDPELRKLIDLEARSMASVIAG